jgi:flagellar biosynthesis protein FlhF
MKMALDCADSGRNAVLIAADRVRMGAREQLRAFGEAAGLEVRDVPDLSRLAGLVPDVPAGSCLFIDAPSGPLDELNQAGIPCYTYLALPAHWQAPAVETALTAFDGQSFDGTILTFIDIATDLAPALSLVLESPLGVAFVSQGRDVSEGMGDIDAASLASALCTPTTEHAANGSLVATA